MSGGIYLMKNTGGLVELREASYDSEALLQELLASHPSLLAGDQINADSPRRWLLISREVSVPSAQDGSGRWALDHLFLDQDAVPTLIEVKRSTDTRLRREVVGQMLDYAANATVYWPVEAIRTHFEARCEREGIDASQLLADHLGLDADVDRFWQAVSTNLQAGRIRMVFVADQIPSELQRIIEFLNGQMSQAEVIGVVVQQFAGEGQRMFVPRVVGLTAAAQQRKSVRSSSEVRQWDEASFFAELEAKRGTAETTVAREILNWATARGLRLWWGQGKTWGSFFPMLDFEGRTYWTVSVWTYGTTEIQFGMLKKQPPFYDEARRRELQRRLNLIPGVSIADAALTQRPPIRLSALVDDQARRGFLADLDWIIDTIKANEITGGAPAAEREDRG